MEKSVNTHNKKNYFLINNFPCTVYVPVRTLACRNVERLLGSEVELENILSQYAVEICLLSVTLF